MPAPKPTSVPHPLLEWPREAGTAAPILEMMETKLRQRRQRRVRTGSRIACLLLFVAGAFWAVPFARDTGTVNTVSAERRTFALADGSTADLNARTRVHTDFRYGRRTVDLTQGEAYFAVKKDSARPFLVNTPTGTVRVTGTAFNVRLDPEGLVVVTLLEGSVSFHRPTGNNEADTILRPMDQLASDSTGVHTQTLTQVETENVLAWRSGYLALDGLSLAEAAARFASYHGVQIRVLANASELRLGGSCPLNDLPGFLAFVRDSAHVQIQSDGESAYLISGR